MELANKVAIITGAGRGIGTAVAQTLAAAGVRVAVNDLNPDRAARVAAAIQQAGGQAMAITADIANKFQCVHLVETTRAAWGQLDILVNHAAVTPQASILKMDEWDWNRCLDVNLKGTFLMSQLCGRVMGDENGERGGVMVNMALAAVEPPPAGRAAYEASKAGVLGFSRACAHEFAGYGIRVYALLLPAEKGEEVARMTAVTVRNLCTGYTAPDNVIALPLPVVLTEPPRPFNSS